MSGELALGPAASGVLAHAPPPAMDAPRVERRGRKRNIDKYIGLALAALPAQAAATAAENDDVGDAMPAAEAPGVDGEAFGTIVVAAAPTAH